MLILSTSLISSLHRVHSLNKQCRYSALTLNISLPVAELCVYLSMCLYYRARPERGGDGAVKWVRAARFGPESAAAWGFGSAAPARSQRSSPTPWFYSPQPFPQSTTGGIKHTDTHRCLISVRTQGTKRCQLSTLWILPISKQQNLNFRNFCAQNPSLFYRETKLHSVAACSCCSCMSWVVTGVGLLVGQKEIHC